MSTHTPVVLIVDDEPLLLDSTARLLSRAGYRVLKASSLEAARAHRSEPIDVVLSDVHMPAADGYAVRAAFLPRCPVVLMSAQAEHEDILPKPFTATMLLSRLEAARSARRSVS